MKNDYQLQKDVIDELEFDPSLTSTNIGVSVKDGVVTLSGFVPSYAEKYAAEKAAFRVVGVRAVAEEIEVHLPGISARSDADIAKAAANVLEWDVSVPATVTVSVEHGRVILRGQVDWAYQRDAAYNAVRSLTGVQGVTNHIEIRTRVQPADVKEKIEKALSRSATEDAQKIRVESRNGKVILSGKVRSFAELEDAKWAAWAVPGVTSVENHLSVGV